VPPGALELVGTVKDAFGASHSWRAAVTAVAGTTTAAPPWGPVEIEVR
jgi:hypothetical protein